MSDNPLHTDHRVIQTWRLGAVRIASVRCPLWTSLSFRLRSLSLSFSTGRKMTDTSPQFLINFETQRSTRGVLLRRVADDATKETR